MHNSAYLLALLLISPLFSEEIDFKYSYGLHDFMVDGNSHTVGVNGAIYIGYQSDTYTKHSASFETFTEYDKNAQDPDHIPVWFRANYDYSTLLLQEDRLKINAIIDFDWKMNTVSSVEQYLKSGAGLAFAFKENHIAITPKLLFGSYYLEIDDDVPKQSGFTREDLSLGFRAAVMYGIDMSWNIQDNLSFHLELEEWNEKGQWLERNTWLGLDYKETEKLHIKASVEKTIYNLDNFSQNNKEVLPWNNDTLIKVVAEVPFEW